MDGQNQELRSRVIAAENSVSGFIKEMNELLENHELSTNIESEENFSLIMSHQLQCCLDEDVDHILERVKDLKRSKF